MCYIIMFSNLSDSRQHVNFHREIRPVEIISRRETNNGNF
jgi:hypothetical protein